MSQQSIPDEQVVPLDDIAAGVRGLRIAFVNVFGIAHPDGSWTLVDAALPFSETLIRRWAEKNFSGPPNAILLTHGHFDHVSAAAELAGAWNVPIYAHPLEFPYLTGQREYPAPNVGAGGGLMSLLSPLYPRGPVNLGPGLRELPFAGSEPASMPQMPGWEAIHTPGHTPGHMSFFRPVDRVLLVGDAFCTTKPESFFEAAIAQSPELHGPPAYFTMDWDEAGRSVRRLSDLAPALVAPGHGKPLATAVVRQELQRLAQEFATGENLPDNQKKKADTPVFPGAETEVA
ncbi:MAG TPA: MBL fold metallo-hydrolase [Terriglobales bacterium]|nr:MBL fold metallo-hydrolase [Terriglobales bacterium]